MHKRAVKKTALAVGFVGFIVVGGAMAYGLAGTATRAIDPGAAAANLRKLLNEDAEHAKR